MELETTAAIGAASGTTEVGLATTAVTEEESAITEGELAIIEVTEGEIEAVLEVTAVETVEVEAEIASVTEARRAQGDLEG